MICKIKKNNVEFWSKQRGVLPETTWCFGKTTRRFLEDSTVSVFRALRGSQDH